MNRSPLLWIGVTLAAAGLGTGNRGLLYVGLALTAAGFVGKERILQGLPPGLRKQISDALQMRSPAIPPGMVSAPTPVAPVTGGLVDPTFEGSLPGPRATTLKDILMWTR